MRIIDPARYKKQPERPKRLVRKRFWLIAVVILAVLLISLTLTPAYRSSISPETKLINVEQLTAVSVPWPGFGQSAIGSSDLGVVATADDQKPHPMASVAKVITALAVLKKYPLTLGERGPDITITYEDAASYHEFLAQDGSVVPVNVGEKLSEYEALQALMLPSGNNIAFTLARWGFGGLDQYVLYANDMLKGMGLNQTAVADASGFSPGTVSNASELVLLGQAALANDVLAEIVAQSTATIPVAGEIRNVNWLLGTDGINGIKTGNTNEAGGNFLFSAPLTLENGQTIEIIGAVMAAKDLATAMKAAPPLLAAAKQNFTSMTVVKKGQFLGSYTTPWGKTVNAVAKDDLSLTVWKGSVPISRTILQPLTAPATAGSPVGQASISAGVSSGNVQAVLEQDLSGPNWLWRLQHRFGKAEPDL